MKISATEEYGLRCLLQVARSNPKPLGIQDIASAEGISNAYAGKLLHLLRKTNLITSHRGPKGGYILARPALEITMAQVVQALSSPKNSKKDLCGQFPGDRPECVHTQESCGLRTVWGRIFQDLWGILENVTIASLMMTEPVAPSANNNKTDNEQSPIKFEPAPTFFKTQGV